ncbi:MAG TPA: ribosome biogenesis factor YjgA [Kofleriaceae bacterium]|nr:ribosome biogenesis factor YjgA [Kofleriaceae bacterium]
MADDDDRDGPSRRQLAKKERRDAGDRSGDLARKLMEMKDSTLAQLELDEELKGRIDAARRVTSHTARRRAERSVAGELRRVDIAEVERKLANVQHSGVAEPQLFHLAERWRTRLIEEGDAAVAEFPGGADEALPRLIAAAKREREIGKPPGAGRALFRHVIDLLRAQAQATQTRDSADAADDADAADGADGDQPG